MKLHLVVPIVLLIAGSIVAGVGANSYLSESSYSLCQACGMKISKTDPSTLVVKVAGQDDKYACCPVCAAQVGLYYQNATVSGACINCGKSVSFTVVNGQLSGSSSTDACMLGGGSCMKNKLADTATCLATLQAKYEWGATASPKTYQQVFTMAQNKLVGVTLTEKPLSLSMSVYAFIASGLLLIAAAPVSWLVLKKRRA